MPASRETVEQGLHYLRMNGRGVFRFATRILTQATQQVVKKAGLEVRDIDLIIPHQANLRIISTAAGRLKLPMDRFAVNLQEYGNTSAASVPIALCEAVEDGRISPGQNLVLVGFGAGLTWAAATVRWGVHPSEATSPTYRKWWRSLLYRWAALRTLVRQALRRLTVLLIRKAERRDGQ